MTNNTNRARILRKNSTPPERLLWSRLRDRQLSGFKFRRQHCMGTRVVDFFCVEKRLAVELDGSGHTFRQRLGSDKVQTVELAAFGIREIRFPNTEVIGNTDWILDAILYELDPAKSRRPDQPASLCSPSPSSSPSGRGKPARGRAIAACPQRTARVPSHVALNAGVSYLMGRGVRARRSGIDARPQHTARVPSHRNLNAGVSCRSERGDRPRRSEIDANPQRTDRLPSHPNLNAGVSSPSGRGLR